MIKEKIIKHPYHLEGEYPSTSRCQVQNIEHASAKRCPLSLFPGGMSNIFGNLGKNPMPVRAGLDHKNMST